MSNDSTDTPRKQDGTGIGPQEAPADEGNGAVGEGFFVSPSNTPPSPSNTPQPEQSWYKTFQGWKPKLEAAKIVLEVVAIPFAIAYAFVTYYQWHDANSNFRIDQRAWVHRAIDAKAPENRIPLAVGSPLVIPMALTNSGKTPAFGVHGSVALSLLPAGTVPEFLYTPGHPRGTIQAEAMYPGTNTDSIPAVLLGTENSQVTALKLTEPQVTGIAAGTMTITIHGRIEYRDIFGRNHWDTFCYTPNMGGVTKDGRTVKIQAAQLPGCVENNNSDNN